MAWLAKSSRGKERLFRNRPRQFHFIQDLTGEGCVDWTDGNPELAGEYDTHIELPKGSIKKLVGRDLTWKDEPVELKEKLTNINERTKENFRPGRS